MSESRVRTYNKTGLCLFCNSPTKGWSFFCSSDCKRNSELRARGLDISKLNDYNWLYNQRIVQRKPIHLIASEMGCSTSVISSSIKKLGIPRIRLQESESKIREALLDKELVERLYFTDGLTFSQIADKLGTSKATVSVYFKKLGLESKPANSYERTIHKTSKEETELFEFVQSQTESEVIRGTRTLLGDGKEVDIYIPEKKLAIEFDGIRYHNSRMKDRNYHKSKTDRCEEKGVHLIHITDVEWHTKKTQWQNYIRHKLGVSARIIYARNCEVVEVDTHTKNQFLEENHLQGADKSTVKLGLVHKSELVAVMTFRPARYTKRAQTELMRFAVKAGLSVPGAFSKLLSHYAKGHRGETLVTYANRNYSNGNVYRVNGFAETNRSGASYFYLKDGAEVITRMNATKRLLKKRLDARSIDYTELQSETELAELLGYQKIYDSGTITFEKVL